MRNSRKSGKTNQQKFQEWLPQWAKTCRSSYNYSGAFCGWDEPAISRGVHPVTKESLIPQQEVKLFTDEQLNRYEETQQELKQQEIDRKRRESVIDEDIYAKRTEIMHIVSLQFEEARREKEEVMDSRKWIEFGKMWNAFETEGFTLDLQSLIDEDFGVAPIEYSVNLYKDDASTIFGDWKATPYAALKEVYFKFYLGMDDCVEEELDLDDDVKKMLEREADQKGVTVDEIIIDALKRAIEHYK